MPTICAKFDPAIEEVWRKNRYLTDLVIAFYRSRVRQFTEYCKERGLDEREHLNLTGAQAFARWYARKEQISIRHAISNIRPALAAWAFAREILGEKLPPWHVPVDPLQKMPPILQEFADHLREHRGNPESTLRIKMYYLEPFLSFLSVRRRTPSTLRPIDIDRYVVIASQRYTRATVATICSALRGFTRFLRVTGRITVDIASSIQSPVLPEAARPHRALPWVDVTRILRAVDRRTQQGCRDYALLLMMSLYGFGAAEIICLTLDDIDWRAGTIGIVRPKTGVGFSLPLLPAVARALVAYLRHGRPTHTRTRHVFVTLKVPHRKFVGAVVIRSILHRYASRAHVTAAFLGTHALRHAHACRQMELGARPKLIGDILGHRDPKSTSAYLRVAHERLRKVALSVPT